MWPFTGADKGPPGPGEEWCPGTKGEYTWYGRPACLTCGNTVNPKDDTERIPLF